MFLKRMSLESIILVICGCALSCCLLFTALVSYKHPQGKTAAAFPIYPQFVNADIFTSIKHEKTYQDIDMAQNSDSSKIKPSKNFEQ